MWFLYKIAIDSCHFNVWLIYVKLMGERKVCQLAKHANTFLRISAKRIMYVIWEIIRPNCENSKLRSRRDASL